MTETRHTWSANKGDGVQPAFIRDVNIRYLLGLIAFAAATLVAFVFPLATVVMTVVLALVFLLGP